MMINMKPETKNLQFVMKLINFLVKTEFKLFFRRFLNRIALDLGNIVYIKECYG